jgi:hypothetical protein
VRESERPRQHPKLYALVLTPLQPDLKRFSLSTELTS